MDFEKTYDSVDQKFLIYVTEKTCHEKWKNWNIEY